jgi:crossover junction endodeoxyribonuclease RuvC
VTQSTEYRLATRVLGVDPGTRVVGWAVVETFKGKIRLIELGAIRARSKDYAARLAEILAGLRAVIARLQPHEAAVEEAFSGRNPRTALVIGEGRGVAMAVIGEAGIPVAAYPVRLVKRCVAGVGNADKEAVARMVALQLGLAKLPQPSDASDACAVAITHCVRRRLPGT